MTQVTRVALLTPFHGSVRAHFAYSLAHVTQHIARERPDLDVRLWFNTSSILPRVRTELAEGAIGWGAEWMLWLDSDHLFPPATLERLLAHGLDVVGANYPRRLPPHAPTAIGLDQQPCATTRAKADAGGVERVTSMGMGVLLTHASVFERLGRPWFGVRDEGARGWTGEDGFFFERLLAEGVPVHVDHALSWEVGHIGQTTLSFQP